LQVAKCLLCNRKLDQPALDALGRLRQYGFPAEQLCCWCFSNYSKIYAILTQPDNLFVAQLNTPVSQGADGGHGATWWTTSENVVVRRVPPQAKRYDFVEAKLVFGNHKIIIGKVLALVEQRGKRIADGLWEAASSSLEE